MFAVSEKSEGLWQPISGRVSPTRAMEFIKFIRLLAKSGKRSFAKCLKVPLEDAHYKTGHIQDSILKLMERIETSLADNSAIHTAGHKAKRLVSRALHDSLSALGDSIIFILERCMRSPRFSTDTNVIDLLNTIGPKLYDFAYEQHERSAKIFEDTLRNKTAQEMQSALEPVALGNASRAVRIDHRMRALFQQVLSASKNDDLPRCRQLLAAYLIRYSDEEFFDEDAVFQITDALEKRENGFKESLLNMVAVQLYYQITDGISRSDMRTAIAGIRKYAHIFQGDSDIRFYFEIDRMERILYGIIKEKNLWKKI